MYWFQDIESARVLARLWSESPRPQCGDGATQDQLPLPASAASLSDQLAMNDAAGSRGVVSVTPCPDG
jgi:hypothetical protein